MSESRLIPEDFFDAEYLYAYAEDFLNTKIATQIRVLREQRGLTQEELAQKIGTKQPGIARLENVNYAAWKVETLKKLAPALGVIFVCGFVSLRTFLDELEKFGRNSLEQPSLDEEIAEQTKTTEEARTEISAKAQYEIEEWVRKQTRQRERQVNPYALSGRINTKGSSMYISYIKLNQTINLEAASGLAKGVQLPAPAVAPKNGINLPNVGSVPPPIRLVA